MNDGITLSWGVIATLLAVIGFGVSAAIGALARLLSSRRRRGAALPLPGRAAELEARLQRIEEALGALALQTERITEEQRSLAARLPATRNPVEADAKRGHGQFQEPAGRRRS